MAYNEKQKEYTLKYLEKLKEIRFRVKPEEFQVYEEAAQYQPRAGTRCNRSASKILYSKC